MEKLAYWLVMNDTIGQIYYDLEWIVQQQIGFVWTPIEANHMFKSNQPMLLY